jgi:hypothetical protein
MNWHNENEVKINPTIKGEAPKSVAKYAKNGKTKLKPRISVNIIVKTVINSILRSKVFSQSPVTRKPPWI